MKWVMLVRKRSEIQQRTKLKQKTRQNRSRSPVPVQQFDAQAGATPATTIAAEADSFAEHGQG
jgi:hypothetical protein